MKTLLNRNIYLILLFAIPNGLLAQSITPITVEQKLEVSRAVAHKVKTKAALDQLCAENGHKYKKCPKYKPEEKVVDLETKRFCAQDGNMNSTCSGVNTSMFSGISDLYKCMVLENNTPAELLCFESATRSRAIVYILKNGQFIEKKDPGFGEKVKTIVKKALNKIENLFNSDKSRDNLLADESRYSSLSKDGDESVLNNSSNDSRVSNR